MGSGIWDTEPEYNTYFMRGLLDFADEMVSESIRLLLKGHSEGTLDIRKDTIHAIGREYYPPIWSADGSQILARELILPCVDIRPDPLPRYRLLDIQYDPHSPARHTPVSCTESYVFVRDPDSGEIYGLLRAISVTQLSRAKIAKFQMSPAFSYVDYELVPNALLQQEAARAVFPGGEERREHSTGRNVIKTEWDTIQLWRKILDLIDADDTEKQDFERVVLEAYQTNTAQHDKTRQDKTIGHSA